MPTFEETTSTEIVRKVIFFRAEDTDVAYDGDPNLPAAPDILDNAPVGSKYNETTAEEIWTKQFDGSWASGNGGGPGSDTTAIHDNIANEISAITEKATPVSADLIVIEDSAAANIKKRVQVGNLPAPSGPGVDTTAIHDNVDAEISAIAEKTAPVAADLVLIEDSAASNAKKKAQLSNIADPDHGVIAVSSSRAFALTDLGQTLRCTTGPTLTAFASAPVGWWCIVEQWDSNAVRMVVDGVPVVTIVSRDGTVGGSPSGVDTDGDQYAKVLVKVDDTNTWLIAGDLA
jgi:hypothetical protein